MGNFADKLGKNLRALRGTESQLQFCKKLGVSQSSYNRIEMGQQNVTLEMMDRLCRRLKCSAGALLDEEIAPKKAAKEKSPGC